MEVYCILRNYSNYLQITGFIQIDSFSSKDACGQPQKVFTMRCPIRNDYNVLPCSCKKKKIKQGDGFVLNVFKSVGRSCNGGFITANRTQAESLVP